MVNVANALLGQCKRHIDYIHMPVPQDRADREYFAPLKQLNLGATELVLGLAHYDDLKGTENRIQTAGEFVPSFGISTECGDGKDATGAVWGISSVSWRMCRSLSIALPSESIFMKLCHAVSIRLRFFF